MVFLPQCLALSGTRSISTVYRPICSTKVGFNKLVLVALPQNRNTPTLFRLLVGGLCAICAVLDVLLMMKIVGTARNSGVTFITRRDTRTSLIRRLCPTNDILLAMSPNIATVIHLCHGSTSANCVEPAALQWKKSVGTVRKKDASGGGMRSSRVRLIPLAPITIMAREDIQCRQDQEGSCRECR